MSESIYVGLDLGSSRCQQTALGADGTFRFSRVIPTGEQSLRNAFAKLGATDVRVHLEAGELSDWAHSVIKPLVASVTVRASARSGVDCQRC